MYRQGDILIKHYEGSLGDDMKKIKSGVIREGINGHQHKLEKGKVLTGKYDGMKLVLEEASEITHPEHKSIKLPAGKYEVVFQRDINSYIQD